MIFRNMGTLPQTFHRSENGLESRENFRENCTVAETREQKYYFYTNV